MYKQRPQRSGYLCLFKGKTMKNISRILLLAIGVLVAVLCVAVLFEI